METLACLVGCYPSPALNDNEGLTHFTQLALHHALVTWPRVWHTVQKLNFYSDTHKQRRGANQREYMSFGSRLDFSLSPSDQRGGGDKGCRGGDGDGENIGRREKQWLTGLTGERIFTKLDINCNALHLRQGTCKVS